MSYALVSDIPASWERYQAIVRFLGRSPEGLLLHLAGPTDEGFRIIEVWVSEDAWRRFAQDFVTAIDSVDPEIGPRATVRYLRAEHVVGADWPPEQALEADREASAGRERGR